MKKTDKKSTKSEMEQGCGSGGCGCSGNEMSNEVDKMVAKDLKTGNKKQETDKGSCSGCC